MVSTGSLELLYVKFGGVISNLSAWDCDQCHQLSQSEWLSLTYINYGWVYLLDMDMQKLTIRMQQHIWMISWISNI